MARFHLDGSYVVCNVCMIFCSWTTTYEDLLLSTEPFQQPITLAVSLVDALFFLLRILTFGTMLI